MNGSGNMGEGERFKEEEAAPTVWDTHAYTADLQTVNIWFSKFPFPVMELLLFALYL